MEVLLNLVWVLLAVAGFTALLSRARRAGQRSTRVRFGQLVAVFLIVLSLFPAVSATDDVLRYQFLFGAGAAGLHDRDASATSSADGLVLSLVRFFDSLEDSTTVLISSFSLLLLAVALAGSPVLTQRSRCHLLCCGRSPPLAA